MSFNSSWQALPYFPISQFYQNKFGEKVWKVPVSTATTCPNRDGIRGMKVCNFCDDWGSAAYPEFREEDLAKQITRNREHLRKRYNANKFLVYFQAYTNTFSKTQLLAKQIDTALKYEDVVGIVIGTRPDCISDALLELWNQCLKKTFVAVELGVQSFSEQHLVWMHRGHTAQRSIQTIFRIREACPEIDLGIHLMFGLPNETDKQIIDYAKLCNQLPIDNIKLHNLHVLKNTPLEIEYNAGLFRPVEKQTYTDRVIDFLQCLNPKTAIHRLTAVASRHNELIAPKWAANKMASYQYVLDRFKERAAYQGQKYIESCLGSATHCLSSLHHLNTPTAL
ncbi:MAG: TIGR01212 family radical SAM protein [Bdellovibrionales bacterium]|nr:TIGR01212 family radical SAM protein [Bdellovibrionales bacterium]